MFKEVAYRFGSLMLLAASLASPATVTISGYSVSRLASGLSWPGGLVYRPAFNDVLVCEFNGNRISKVDVQTGFVSPFGSTRITMPEHIAVNSDGNVYVTTDADGGPVTVLTSAGQLVTAFPVSGHPVGIAFDSNDNLYVANNGTRVIARYAARSFSSPIPFAGSFRSLQGITFDATGRLFAEDYVAGIVYEVTPTANNVWATGVGSNDNPMMNIAYHPRSASLLVNQYTSGTILQIAPKGIVSSFATGFSHPIGIAVDASQNIYVTEADTGAVWKFTAEPPLPSFTSAGIVNAASFAPGLVPGGLVSIFGTGLSRGITGTAFAGGATSFAGTSVSIGGTLAPLLSITSQSGKDQVNLQVPFETPTGSTTVQVNNNGALFAVGGVPVFASRPGIFEISLTPTGPRIAAVIHLNGQLVTSANPAQHGEVLSLFLTGAGAVQPPVPTGAIGPIPPATTVVPAVVGVAGIGGPVLFSGYAPGYIGLYQVNFQIPAGVPSGPNVSLDVRFGDVFGKTSAMAVR